VFEAIEALAGKIPYFEVNTGAIARGYRTTPYPMPFIIKEFQRRGFGVVLTSDCHNVAFLDCWFEEAAELLKEWVSGSGLC
jgi:histidinol-phosphatase (PHP family)